ncbi:MAG: extracellular solute-binding protein [Phycisphaerales bacterium]|nr:MAG: extracellular solute-binding protein [Phycisphaerales bacterium]
MNADPLRRGCRFASNAGLVGTILALMLLTGCGGDEQEQVVLYSSLNEPTARPVIDRFEEKTGIRVIFQGDTERDKTVGLVQSLLEERHRPRADVFWNSETANTVRLQREGVLARLDPPPDSAALIPDAYVDPEGYWFGFAARARVLIVNTDLVEEAEMPNSMWDLTDEKWRGKAALVRPVTGTTLTHMTALYEIIGEEETNRFIQGVIDNECHLPPGNGRLAQLVGQGQIHFGFTDTSDFRLVKNEGYPVIAIYPDQDSIGTMLIPNTVSKIRGGPNPENARKLINFLLSEEAEEILAHHPRGHIPLKPDIDRPEEVLVPGDFEVMEVDFQRVGEQITTRLDQFDRRFR